MLRIRVFMRDVDPNVYEYIYDRKDDNIVFVDDDSYTHAIVINTEMPFLRVTKENVLGIAYEPIEFLNITPEFVEYAQKRIGRYLIGKVGNLPAPFEEHYTYQFHNWGNTPFKTYDEKPELMSLMLSQKRFLPGHVYRYRLAIEILKRNIPVDIIGRGCEIIKAFSGGKNDPRVKGSFRDDAELLRDYKFTIAVENTQSNKYMSEKLTNSFVHNTIPLYLGAEKVDETFGEGCCIKLSGNIEMDLGIIEDVLTCPDKYRRDMTVYRDRLFGSKECCLLEFLKSIWLK
jgi:hypothetical protein